MQFCHLLFLIGLVKGKICLNFNVIKSKYHLILVLFCYIPIVKVMPEDHEIKIILSDLENRILKIIEYIV